MPDVHRVPTTAHSSSWSRGGSSGEAGLQPRTANFLGEKTGKKQAKIQHDARENEGGSIRKEAVLGGGVWRGVASAFPNPNHTYCTPVCTHDLITGYLKFIIIFNILLYITHSILLCYYIL